MKPYNLTQSTNLVFKICCLSILLSYGALISHTGYAITTMPSVNQPEHADIDIVHEEVMNTDTEKRAISNDISSNVTNNTLINDISTDSINTTDDERDENTQLVIQAESDEDSIQIIGNITITDDKPLLNPPSNKQVSTQTSINTNESETETETENENTTKNVIKNTKANESESESENQENTKNDESKTVIENSTQNTSNANNTISNKISRIEFIKKTVNRDVSTLFGIFKPSAKKTQSDTKAKPETTKQEVTKQEATKQETIKTKETKTKTQPETRNSQNQTQSQFEKPKNIANTSSKDDDINDIVSSDHQTLVTQDKNDEGDAGNKTDKATEVASDTNALNEAQSEPKDPSKTKLDTSNKPTNQAVSNEVVSKKINGKETNSKPNNENETPSLGRAVDKVTPSTDDLTVEDEADSLNSIAVTSTSTKQQPQPQASVSNSRSAYGYTDGKIFNLNNVKHQQHIRRLLAEAGLLASIESIEPSSMPNLYRVDLGKHLKPLHISQDGKYVIEGEIEQVATLKANQTKGSMTVDPHTTDVKNNDTDINTVIVGDGLGVSKRNTKSDTKTIDNILDFIVTDTNSADTLDKQSQSKHVINQAGQLVDDAVKASLLDKITPLDVTARTLLFHTAIPQIFWGTTNSGKPFMISDDGNYFTYSEISVIKNGQFIGLDGQFEQHKNANVLSKLKDEGLIIYPATTQKLAQIYVALDINCRYCQSFHQYIPKLNQQGIEVKVIGYSQSATALNTMRSFWCLHENARKKTFELTLQTGILSKTLTGDCQTHTQNQQSGKQSDTLFEDNRHLANALAIPTTPAIYRADGVLFTGNYTQAEFLTFLGLK